MTDGASEGPLTVIGAEVLAREGFSDFFGKRVGLIASRASIVRNQNTIDLFADAEGVELTAIFAPEHGIRAEAGAGVTVGDEVDPVTGLPIFSLYGQTKRPTPEMLTDVDVLVFDLQDVGTRFYTYTATMGLAMQAAAEVGVPFVVLDRPNPLGGRLIDGNLRDSETSSFVSQYPIPAVHGMTAGELALAIKGEGWLDGLEDLDIRIVKLQGWERDTQWHETGLPWYPPSPGLPTAAAAGTYPATVLFEATTLSFGRGTDHPFEQIGAPWLDGEALADRLNTVGLPGVRFDPVIFAPEAPIDGEAAGPQPQYAGQDLPGVRLLILDGDTARPFEAGVYLLHAVLEQAAGLAAPPPDAATVIDRPEFLDLLTGSAEVRRALSAGTNPAAIVAEWSDDLVAFEQVRAKYLQY